MEEDIYVESEFDNIAQLLEEQRKKAFKYECLVRKVKEKIEELENLKLCSDKFYQLITEDKIKLLQELLEEE